MSTERPSVRIPSQYQYDVDMDLSAALTQFDRTMANLDLLDQLWEEYEAHLPSGLVFEFDSPETEQIRRRFRDIANALPAIDKCRVDTELPSLSEMSQMEFDTREIGFPEAYVDLVEFKQQPKIQLDEYRHQVIRKRRQLVRQRIREVVSDVDELLRLTRETEQGREFDSGAEGWIKLESMIAEADRLRGTESLRSARLVDLHRHIRFAEPHDLQDIVELDWPSVRAAMLNLVFEDEPMQIEVDDLGDLVRSEPKGPVMSQLEWDHLDSERFERLVFDILHSAESYENIEWLMRTNAPDGGRDISAERVVVDELSGTERYQVLFQCKHWQTRSIGITEISSLLQEVSLWTRPFTEVVIVTSGRFTQPAVEWREKREMQREIPTVKFWANSHLEYLVSSRPSIRGAYF